MPWLEMLLQKELKLRQNARSWLEMQDESTF
jgi:hypothetical protein